MKILTTALVALFLMPASARADYYFAGEHDVTLNPFVQRLFRAGQGWWSKQGVTTCGFEQGLHVLIAPDLDGAAGRTAGCTIWIQQKILMSAIKGAPRGWWSSVAWACNIAWHEEAHTPPALLSHPTPDHLDVPDQYARYEWGKTHACRRFATRVFNDAWRSGGVS